MDSVLEARIVDFSQIHGLATFPRKLSNLGAAPQYLVRLGAHPSQKEHSKKYAIILLS